MIEGLVWARPSLLKLHDHNVVVRRDMAVDSSLRDQRVALISGACLACVVLRVACVRVRVMISLCRVSRSQVAAADMSQLMLGLLARVYSPRLSLVRVRLRAYVACSARVCGVCAQRVAVRRGACR
jgi:hypothetical protein